MVKKGPKWNLELYARSLLEVVGIKEDTQRRMLDSIYFPPVCERRPKYTPILKKHVIRYLMKEHLPSFRLYGPGKKIGSILANEIRGAPLTRRTDLIVIVQMVGDGEKERAFIECQRNLGNDITDMIALCQKPSIYSSQGVELYKSFQNMGVCLRPMASLNDLSVQWGLMNRAG